MPSLRWLRNASLAAASGSMGIALLALSPPAASQAPPDRKTTPPAAKPEPGEDRPGGAATSLRSSTATGAFSLPSANIGFDGGLDFKIGSAMFRKTWIPAPASTRLSDGLGPLYNARSCHGCHIKDGRGHPPADDRPADAADSMFLRLSIPPRSEEEKQLLASGRAMAIPEPTYGSQLQEHAIKGHRIEGRMRLVYESVPVTLGDGEIVHLRKPAYSVTDLGYGPMHPETKLSPRVAPQMIGLGLLEAIPESVLLAYADADDTDRDGISGRPNRVWSRTAGAHVIGRFGWKAGAANVLEQSAEAFALDIGISSWIAPRPSGDCTPGQTLCLSAPSGRDGATEEVSRRLLGLVARYARNLAVPKRRDHDAPRVLEGKAIFASLGCIACHRPNYVAGEHAEEPHLSGQSIWPYTDLLLHDMGEGLADGRPEGQASGREWRTPPLWGIGLTQSVSGHTQFLHDGRARNLTEAILWHGGEAQAARDGFASLPRAAREKLLGFLNSL